MERETELKARLRREILEVGGLALSLHGHSMQEPGWPDLWACHRKCGAWWVELKRGAGELTTAQRLRIRAIGERGGNAVVARLISSALLVLEDEDGIRLLDEFAATGLGLIDALSTFNRIT